VIQVAALSRGGLCMNSMNSMRMPREIDPATASFLARRSLLFTVAYQILGSAVDAEDVVQEVWLRWVGVDSGEVRDERAYLTTMTTRLSLDRARAIRRRREAYLGPWLPDPILTTPDVAEDVVLAESVSMAIMLVLETLAPTERAVFVLREVFGFAYEEIADAVSKSPSAVRQVAHRARHRVRMRRPREPVPAEEARTAVEAFHRALTTGDFQSLMDVLAPDVVLLTDGGGSARAALRPISGAEKVVRYITGGIAKHEVRITADLTTINGSPAVLLRVDDELDGVLAVRMEVGRVVELYYVRNPA
jgi:RNA polymerase sigma-70 factor (ECF subfamily)